MISNFTSKRFLITLIIVQSICASFLLVDSVADYMGKDQPIGVKDTDKFEYIIVLVLIVSILCMTAILQKLYTRNKTVESKLKAASGEFSILLDEHFHQWQLTNSEKDVALLAIKGLDIEEISIMRETKSGTIKAQLNSIYKKAQVTGRPQLISYFIEKLMSEKLI